MDIHKNGWALFLAFLFLILIVMRVVQSGTLSSGNLEDVIVSEVGVRNSCIATEEGIYDYVELYNPTDKAINITGLGIGDSTAAPGGAITGLKRIGAGETLLITLGHGNMDFGLKNGETLTLFDRENTPFFTLPLESMDKNTVLVYTEGGYEVTDTPSPGYPNTDEGVENYNEYLKVDTGILINELCAGSLTLTDGGDWAEIVNDTDETVRFSDMYLSDSRSYLFKIKVNGGTLSSGEVMLIDLSDSANGKTFGLKEGETLYLSTADGRIADSVKVLGSGVDQSQGREELLDVATPGYPNTQDGRDSYLELKTWGLVINEVVSDNASYLKGPYGATHDYIELLNASKETVDLSVYSISKNADGTRYPVGEGELAPGEVRVIFAEKDITRALQGYDSVDFGISASGCSLVLWMNEDPIDSCNVPKLSTGEAWSRDENMEFTVSVPTPDVA